MKERDCLKMTSEPFTEETCEEVIGHRFERKKYFEKISNYSDGEEPTLEEIKICEKVLKYACECKWLGFNENDLGLVLEHTTHPLKWNFGYKF